MRRLSVLLVFVAIISFAFNISYGGRSIKIEEIDFDSTYALLNDYSNFLRVESPSTGAISSFKYIEWKGKFVSFSRNVLVLDEKPVEEVSIEDIFKFFDIPFRKDEKSYRLPDMIISKVVDFRSYIQFDYNGEYKLEISKNEDLLKVYSQGLIYYDDSLFEKGAIIFSKKIDLNFEMEINKLPGRVIIQFFREYNIDNLIVKVFGEKIDSYDSKSFALVFKDSNLNIIFVPNYSPDFDGKDWKIFSISEKIGKVTSKRFKLKIYYLPFVQLPKDLPGIIIFAPKETWNDIKKFIEEEIM
ncbi:hypothetical protein XJ44_00250 [Thermosipho affectus]|uniref:Uncharacterized protein n=1 Tax=Thermosipho affectus TaxID=660294 RepID=A0ABX3ILP6_9BACT|nr:DUF4941 domain-containing protein [Thermosipho affectus]ONN28132.1 hypothetical protein XJ44_00250 [Thermosipho affectus]